MPKDEIEAWLKKKVKYEILGKSLIAVSMFILSSIILFITFWIIYFVVYLGSEWIYPVSHTILCCISFIAIGLVFWGSLKTSKEYLSDYSFSTDTATDKIVVIPGVGSNINPFAPDSMHSYVKFITTLLYIGPNIFMFALKNLKQVIHLAKVNTVECAEVIKLLLNADKKIPVSNILSQLSFADSKKVFLDLSCLDGILFLSKDQPALALSSKLREELEGFGYLSESASID